jgi:superfamily II DNA or RNA helicase
MTETYPCAAALELVGNLPAALDISLALGYPAERLAIKTDQPYSERGQLLIDAKNKVFAWHTNHAEASHQAAAAAGMAITEDEILNWEPGMAELDQLSSLLRAERVRANMLDGIDELLNNTSKMNQLRPAQKDALYAFRDFMEFASRDANGGKSGYIDMPTGTGKTRTFIHIIEALASKQDKQDPARVLVIAPTNVIREQTIGSMDVKRSSRTGIAAIAPNLHNDVGTYYYGDHNLTGKIDVVTNAAFNQLVESGELQNYDAVVFDEVHTGLGPNISENLERYRNKSGAIVVGFTATTEYHEEKSVSQLLTHEIYKLGLPHAISTGQLAPVSAEDRPISLEFDKADLPENARERNAVIRDAYFHAMLENALPDIIKDVREGRPVLVRCPPGGDIAYAKEVEALLQSKIITTINRNYAGPIKARAVGGSGQNKDDLKLLLQGYKDGNVHVIIWVDLLNMGVDLPNAQNLYDLYAQEAQIPVTQAGGRVLRTQKDPVTKKPIEAKIVSYRVPYLANQFTMRNALRLDMGQARLTETRNYQPRYKALPLVFQQIGARILAGAAEVDSYNHADNIALEAVPSITFDDACVQLNIPAAAMDNLLVELGYEGRPELPLTDYMTIAELYDDGTAAQKITEPSTAPGQKRPVLVVPELGFTSVDKYMLLTDWRNKRDLMRQLRNLGIKLHKFQTTDGVVDYYIPNKFIPDHLL